MRRDIPSSLCPFSFHRPPAVYLAVLASPRPPNPATQMSKFAKETDDIRAASTLASGFIIQHLITTIASLVLAFLRS